MLILRKNRFEAMLEALDYEIHRGRMRWQPCGPKARGSIAAASAPPAVDVPALVRGFEPGSAAAQPKQGCEPGSLAGAKPKAGPPTLKKGRAEPSVGFEPGPEAAASVPDAGDQEPT